MNKRCSRCKQFKPLNTFIKNRSRKDGRHHYCTECRRQYYIEHREEIRKSQQKYYINNREKIRKRARIWAKEKGRYSKYGITKRTFERMLEEQDNKCKICGIDFIGILPSDIHIDHCHKTGKVRGLLCRKCNQSLWLESYWKKATEYLNEI